ncbi:hypothetical protein N9065_03160 [Akkermansiaceae bacterium]|nr:hypothetical protein [Akkermansiaceae bacterium]
MACPEPIRMEARADDLRILFLQRHPEKHRETKEHHKGKPSVIAKGFANSKMNKRIGSSGPAASGAMFARQR